VLIEDVGDIGQHSGVSSLSLGKVVLIEDVADIGQHSGVSSLSLGRIVLIEDVGDIGQHSSVSSLSLGKVVLIEDVADIGQHSGVSSLSLGRFVLIEDVGDIGQHSGVSSLSLGRFVLIEDIGDVGQHSGVSSLPRRPKQGASNSRGKQKSSSSPSDPSSETEQGAAKDTLSVMSSSSTDSEIGQEEQPNEKLPTPDHLLGKVVLIEDVCDIGQHSGVSSLSWRPMRSLSASRGAQESSGTGIWAASHRHLHSRSRPSAC